MTKLVSLYLDRMRYQSRGNRAAPDFSIGDFTLDGNPHDLDLAYLGDGIKLIDFTVHLNGNGYFNITPKGYTLGYLNSFVFSVGGWEANFKGILELKPSKLITYQGSAAGLVTVNLTINGVIR